MDKKELAYKLNILLRVLSSLTAYGSLELVDYKIIESVLLEQFRDFVSKNEDGDLVFCDSEA